MIARALGGAAAAVCLTLHISVARAQETGDAICGSLENAIGPMDYHGTSPEVVRLRNDVELNHFNDNVRSLRGGQNGGTPIGDLDYILRAFPNAPQALMLVAKYELGGGQRGRFRSAECYFDRALRFVPGDPMVRMLRAIYLSEIKRNDEALAEYRRAIDLAPNYAEAHYNLGLLLVQLGRLDEARVAAEKAYSLGFPLAGLRNQLVRRNAWPEAATATSDR